MAAFQGLHVANATGKPVIACELADSRSMRIAAFVLAIRRVGKQLAVQIQFIRFFLASLILISP